MTARGLDHLKGLPNLTGAAPTARDDLLHYEAEY